MTSTTPHVHNRPEPVSFMQHSSIGSSWDLSALADRRLRPPGMTLNILRHWQVLRQLWLGLLSFWHYFLPIMSYGLMVLRLSLNGSPL